MAKKPVGLRKRLRRAKGMTIRALSKGYIAYETAKSPFGKKFLDSFPKQTINYKKGKSFVIGIGISGYESNKTLFIRSETIHKSSKLTEAKFGFTRKSKIPLAEAKLGFTKKAVIIEALQGKKSQQAELDRFRQKQGKPWANYLIGKIEEHAKRLGFSEVRIRLPETLHYFEHPMSHIPVECEAVRQRMESLYEKAAKAMGYTRKFRFFVKKL